MDYKYFTVDEESLGIYKTWSEMTEEDKKINAIRMTDKIVKLQNELVFLRKLLLVQSGFDNQEDLTRETEL